MLRRRRLAIAMALLRLPAAALEAGCDGDGAGEHLDLRAEILDRDGAALLEIVGDPVQQAVDVAQVVAAVGVETEAAAGRHLTQSMDEHAEFALRIRETLQDLLLG